MGVEISAGKVLADANLSGSRFDNVNLAGTTFHNVNLSEADYNDVNLSHARFHNTNLSDMNVTAVQIGGAVFKHIGPPCDKDGNHPRQRPVRFEEAQLCDSTFEKVDRQNHQLQHCRHDD